MPITGNKLKAGIGAKNGCVLEMAVFVWQEVVTWDGGDRHHVCGVGNVASPCVSRARREM